MVSDRTGRLVESLLQSAENAIVAHDWEEALGFVEDVRVLDPDNPEVQSLLHLVERHTEGINVEEGRRFVTVMFADMVDSTNLGERLELEPYAALMRLFEAAGRPVIDRYGGHIHNFFGDGLVAYFGYPTGHEDDARRAVAASLEVLNAVNAVAPRASEMYEADLKVRIGVYSGEVVLADRGSGAWMERSAAFGPTMNRAARLQSAAPPNRVVISESTLGLLNDEFEVTSLGAPSMKGIPEPIAIYEVVERRNGIRATPPIAGSFVGRAEPLSMLNDQWQKVLADPTGNGTERAMEVVGEPGIGKTRLISEFVNGLDQSATTSVELQCSSHASHIPLWPVRALVASYVGLAVADSPSDRADKLAVIAVRAGREAESAVPILANLLRTDIGDVYPPVELTPLQLREAVLSTMQDLVVGLSKQQPTLLIVEDAHWADQLTLELVQRVVQVSGPIMAILASRRAGMLGGGAGTLTVRLETLPRPQAAILASALMPAETSLDTIELVADRSDGVPLFIDQVARSVAAATDPATAIPAGLKELLQTRLDAVGGAVRTAQIASVIGRDFELETLRSVSSRLDDLEAMAAVDVDRDTEDLLTAGLIEAEADGRFRFRHALVENKAYDSMLTPVRERIHVAVAECLAEQIAAGRQVDPGFVAVHYDRAGRATEAVTAYLQAAQGAIGAGGLEAALQYLTTAHGLLDDVAPELHSALELGVRLTRGYVISSSQGYAAPAAVDDFSVALTLCEALADQPWVGVEVIKGLFGIWTFHAASGDLESCVEAERLLDQQLETIDYAGGRPALMSCVGVRHFYLGDYREARRLLESAVTAFESDDIDFETWLLPNDPMVAAGAFLMLARFLDGDEVGAIEIRDRVEARAEGLPFPQGPFSLAFLAALEGWIHRFHGDQAGSHRCADRLLTLGARHGFVDWHLVGQMNLPATRAMTNPSMALATEMEQVIDQWRSLGAVVLVNNLLIELAGIYLDLDDEPGARRCLAAAFELAEGGQRVGLPEAHLVEARLEARVGNDEACLDRIKAAVQCGQDQAAPLYVIRAGLAAVDLLGDDAATAFASDVRAALGRFSTDSTLPDLQRARTIV